MRKRPEVFTAYDHMLRALELISSLDRSTFPQARVFLEQAMEQDPNFAMAVRLGGALAQHQCRAGLVAGLEGRRRRGREAGAARHRPRQGQRAGARDLRPRALVPVPRMRECARLFRSRPRRLPEPLSRLDLVKRTMSYLGRGREAVERAERAMRCRRSTATCTSITVSWRWPITPAATSRKL